MPVIDFRFRPPTDDFKRQHRELTPIFGLEPSQAWLEMDMETCVREMKKLDLIGIVMGRDIPATRVSNEHVKSIVERYPDRFIPFAGINASPANRRIAQDEIDKVIKKWGFKGIQIEHGYLDPPLLPDDRRLYPIYAQCEDLGTIVSFQIGVIAGPTIEFSSPLYVQHVAIDFPKLKIVVTHGCYPYAMEAVALVRKYPDVWCSPDAYHLYPGQQVYVELGNSPRFHHRYIYGSAAPYGPGFKEYLEWWRKLPWNEAYVDDLLYNNAAQLLGLKK